MTNPKRKVFEWHKKFDAIQLMEIEARSGSTLASFVAQPVGRVARVGCNVLQNLRIVMQLRLYGPLWRMLCVFCSNGK